MPRLNCWLIRTLLANLILGFLTGAIMLAGKGELFPRSPAFLLPLHMELLLVGAMVQLAAGVAFWILPRNRTGRERGDERPAWSGYLLLNLGVFGAGTAGVLGATDLIFAGRGCEFLDALGFALNAWPRIKAFAT